MIRFIMTAVSKAKPLPLGSGSGLKGQRSHLRNFQSQSSPVYKLQSESANGTRGVRNNRVKERRGIFTVGGNNDKTKVKSLEDVAAAIKNEVFQNIVVVAGAGISTPSGIPDFRFIYSLWYSGLLVLVSMTTSSSTESPTQKPSLT